VLWPSSLGWCIFSPYMRIFLMCLGQADLKVSSAFLHMSLRALVPAISCASQGAAGQVKPAGKGAAGTSPNLTRRTSCAGASSAAPISVRKSLCWVPLLTGPSDFQSQENCPERHSPSIFQAAKAPWGFPSESPALSHPLESKERQRDSLFPIHHPQRDANSPDK